MIEHGSETLANFINLIFSGHSNPFRFQKFAVDVTRSEQLHEIIKRLILRKQKIMPWWHKSSQFCDVFTTIENVLKNGRFFTY